MSDTYYAIADSTLTNIADAIRAKGVSGTMTPAEMPAKIGAIPTGGVIVKPVVMRGDAELVHRWSADDLLVEDLGIAMPAYSTTAKVLVTGAALTPTYTLDWVHYCYYVYMRGLAYGIYNTTTRAKGMHEWGASEYLYEITDVPPNTMYDIAGNKTITSRSAAATSSGSIGRTYYWTSATAAAVITNVTYGVYINGQAPTVSSSVLTAKAPNYGVRGNTTYCTSANWSKWTDLRYQWIVELWRAEKQYLTDGWGMTSGINAIMTDIRENGGTLRPIT